jgi:hypothetical protein
MRREKDNACSRARLAALGSQLRALKVQILEFDRRNIACAVKKTVNQGCDPMRSTCLGGSGRLRSQGSMAAIRRARLEASQGNRGQEIRNKSSPEVSLGRLSDVSQRGGAKKCSQFFRVLLGHDDPPARKLCNDGEEFKR